MMKYCEITNKPEIIQISKAFKSMQLTQNKSPEIISGTFICPTPIHSFNWKTMTSSRAMIMYCIGEHFPSTAPKLIRTAAEANSAVNILKGKKLLEIACSFHYSRWCPREFQLLLFLRNQLLFLFISSLINRIAGKSVKKHARTWDIAEIIGLIVRYCSFPLPVIHWVLPHHPMHYGLFFICNACEICFMSCKQRD